MVDAFIILEPGSPGTVNKAPAMSHIDGVPGVLGLVQLGERFLRVIPTVLHITL